MNRLLARASRRYLLAHRGQTLLTVIGIAVGVAAWVSVQTAARGADEAFSISTAQAFGIATHQLLPLGRTLDETRYLQLRRDLGIRSSAPVLEGRVRLVGEGAATVSLLGIDPLAESELRPDSVAADAPATTLLRLIGARDQAVISSTLAARLDLAAGDTLAIQRAAGPRLLTVAAVVDEQRLPLGAETLLMDLAGAQWLTGQAGKLSRVDLVLDPAQRSDIERWLPDTLELVSTTARSEAVRDMTRSYRLNLQALGLLTLLVGVLLVYSALSHLVVQRGAVFGRFRALGLDRGAIRRLVLVEAAALGLAGGVIGTVIGVGLADWLVELMARNITDLYFRVQVGALAPDLRVAAAGVALGIAASLAGAWAPAGEAARGVRLNALTRALPSLGASIGCALLAWLLLAGAGGALIPAFGGLFLAALAGVLLLVPLVVLVCRVVRPLVRADLTASMTVREVRAGLHRTGVALAGLTLAVATVVAIDTMVGSFRASVVTWLDGAVAGDVIISADSAIHVDAADAPLEELAGRLTATEWVTDLRRTRFVRLREQHGQTVLLRASEFQGRVPGIVRGEAGAAFDAGEGVLISEPLAQRRGLEPGDPLALAFASGTETLPVLGVFRDYLSERGVVMMSFAGYRAVTDDLAISTLAVDVTPDDPDVQDERVRALLPPAAGLNITVSGDIRDQTMEIFDRTFTVTRVLKFLAAGVAFLGVLGSFLALLLERHRLRRTLRALGMSETMLGRLALLESAVLGTAAALLALPLGLVLSGLLISVINVRSFGWSMDFTLLPVPLLQGAGLAVGTALAAGAVAAWLFARESGEGLHADS